MLTIPITLRVLLIAGSFIYLGIILFMLRRRRLNVRYSIIWLASAAVFLLFSIFPYSVAVLCNLLGVEMPANLVFTMLFIFMLLLLLSLSAIVTGFAGRIKQLTQHQALLEERLRRLEAKNNAANTRDKTAE